MALARDDALDGIGTASVGYVLELDAPCLLELHGGDVIGNADTGIAKRHLAWIGLGVCHQFGHGLDRDTRVHGEHVGRKGNHADGCQILGRAVRHAGEQVRRDRQRADVDQQKRVAILVGMGHEVGANIPASARLVLDHYWLADGVLKLRTDQPRENVARSAGCERHNDPDRLCEILRRGGGRHKSESQSDESRKSTEHATVLHVFLPVSVRTQNCACIS